MFLHLISLDFDVCFTSSHTKSFWRYSFHAWLLTFFSYLQALVKVLLNVEGCVVVGGCVLAVDLLTVVHENSERTPIPLQSNLIAATAFMEPPKEWMYIDKGGAEVGPVEKDVIRSLWSKKDIDWTTKCRALGMLDWKKLRDIRELRWAVAVRVPVLTPTQVKLYG